MSSKLTERFNTNHTKILKMFSADNERKFNVYVESLLSPEVKQSSNAVLCCPDFQTQSTVIQRQLEHCRKTHSESSGMGWELETNPHIWCRLWHGQQWQSNLFNKRSQKNWVSTAKGIKLIKPLLKLTKNDLKILRPKHMTNNHKTSRRKKSIQKISWHWIWRCFLSTTLKAWLKN